MRIKCVNGRVYYGTCDGDYEEEDSKGNNVYAIGTENRIFIQEQVEDVEFPDWTLLPVRKASIAHGKRFYNC